MFPTPEMEQSQMMLGVVVPIQNKNILVASQKIEHVHKKVEQHTQTAHKRWWRKSEAKKWEPKNSPRRGTVVNNDNIIRGKLIEFNPWKFPNRSSSSSINIINMRLKRSRQIGWGKFGGEKPLKIRHENKWWRSGRKEENAIILGSNNLVGWDFYSLISGYMLARGLKSRCTRG